MKFNYVIYMKIVKKVILLFIFSITLLSTFLIPRTYAQEWVYDGVDTENIPEFSVYPSELYVFDPDSGVPPEIYYQIEIVRGDISDPFMMGNATCVWGNAWTLNTTSGARTLDTADAIWAYWNETIGYFSDSYPLIIPVDNGTVSASILTNVNTYLELIVSSTGGSFENQQIYPSIYSISHWNTSNNAFLNVNFTSDGILTQWESYLLPAANMTLVSQPAQLPPVFSFTTENDTLTVNVTDIDLKVAITYADNNNDGMIDTAYEYRIFYNSTWSSWAAVPPLIDFDLGSVPAGNYIVLMEVKNMYGITQEQIEIEYEPPGDGDGKPFVPGYPTLFIAIAIFMGISFLILKNRMKK